MDQSTAWRDFFQRWPKGTPRRGVLVVSFDQFPFVEFLTGEHMIYVERRTPDTLGARTAVVPYAEIQGVKFTDVIDRKVFQGVGFTAGEAAPALAAR